MPNYKLMIAQFPGGGVTSSHTGIWFTETYCKMRDDPRIGKGNVLAWQIADTPITMGRNRCLEVALDAGIDYVLMIDSDMKFDAYVGARGFEHQKPFWDTAWEFALSHDGPCVVCAPYVGPPPYENVYVFDFESTQCDDPNPNFKLLPYSRPHAAVMRGIQRCAAIPTGLCLIDMRGVKRLDKPYFYYEWTNETHSEKASTEDVTFSRDLHYAGVPLYCQWDSWACHIKPKMCGMPQVIPPENVPKWIVERGIELAEMHVDRSKIGHLEKPRGDFLLSPKPSKMKVQFAVHDQPPAGGHVPS